MSDLEAEHSAVTRTTVWRAIVPVATAGLLALLYCAVVLWTPGRLVDQELLDVTQHVVGGAAGRAAELLRRVMSPAAVSLAALTLLGWSAWRRRALDGLVVLVVLVVAVLTTETLKLGLLSRPDDVRGLVPALLPGTGSFPSGHVTVAAALGLGLLRLTAPGRAAVGLVVWSLLAAASAGVVVAGWHRPGDAVAGVLVALLAHQVSDLALGRRRCAGAGADDQASAAIRAEDQLVRSA